MLMLLQFGGAERMSHRPGSQTRKRVLTQRCARSPRGAPDAIERANQVGVICPDGSPSARPPVRRVFLAVFCEPLWANIT